MQIPRGHAEINKTRFFFCSSVAWWAWTRIDALLLMRERAVVPAPVCVLVLVVLVVVYMWEQERLCSVLAAAFSVSPTDRDASAANACLLLRVHLTTHTDMKWSCAGHNILISICPGELHSPTETPWRELLMENGDRQRVLQHRLLGIYPDYLDFQRVVAWSSGSHIPPAIHVSDGLSLMENIPGFLGGDGRQLWACPLSCGLRDT